MRNFGNYETIKRSAALKPTTPSLCVYLNGKGTVPRPIKGSPGHRFWVGWGRPLILPYRRYRVNRRTSS